MLSNMRNIFLFISILWAIRVRLMMSTCGRIQKKFQNDGFYDFWKTGNKIIPLLCL